MRVLVTGARGYIGAAVAHGLLQEGHEVIGSGRECPEDASRGFVPANLSDPEKVERLFEHADFDAVVHCAARLSGDDATAFYRDNVLATENLVREANRHGVRRFVALSTISVYSGDGPFCEESLSSVEDLYCRSKRLAEEICLAADLEEVVVLRLAGVHGGKRRSGIVNAMFERAASNRTIELSEPDTLVTLTFVDDVVDAVAYILGQPGRSRRSAYNLAVREPRTYRELANEIVSLVGSHSPIVVPEFSRKRNRVLHTERLCEEIGFIPTPLISHLSRCASATVLR
jgi:nucleoside-diphosphate-sugar epimerase